MRADHATQKWRHHCRLLQQSRLCLGLCRRWCAWHREVQGARASTHHSACSALPHAHVRIFFSKQGLLQEPWVINRMHHSATSVAACSTTAQHPLLRAGRCQAPVLPTSGCDHGSMSPSSARRLKSIIVSCQQASALARALHLSCVTARSRTSTTSRHAAAMPRCCSGSPPFACQAIARCGQQQQAPIDASAGTTGMLAVIYTLKQGTQCGRTKGHFGCRHWGH